VIEAIVWDLGNVLVRWDVRALYRTIFDDPDEMEHFLSEVWTPAHNLRCDAGEPYAEVIAEVVAEHPEHEAAIRAAWDRWIETIPGPVEGSLELLEDLRDAGYPQFGLTNFSAETLPLIGHYPHFELLDDVVASGHLGVTKPDPRIYRIVLERAGVEADQAVFLDDSEVNIEGARAVGMHTILFTGADAARRALVELGVRVPARPRRGGPSGGTSAAEQR
jgi:HAD superfamily hydrolase (TIGR01509 family)